MRVLFWAAVSLMFGSLSLYAVAWYAAVMLGRPNALPTVVGSGIAAICFCVVASVALVVRRGEV